MSDKFCKDCKHYDPEWSDCRWSPDPVTGVPSSAHAVRGGPCGVTAARGFEPRPREVVIRRRPFRWFGWFRETN